MVTDTAVEDERVSSSHDWKQIKRNLSGHRVHSTDPHTGLCLSVCVGVALVFTCLHIWIHVIFCARARAHTHIHAHTHTHTHTHTHI